MKNKENEKIMKQNTCRTIVNIPIELDQAFREMAVKRGIAKIAIGTRSAVFAPFENLGLIIIDEEQEHTYKSESTPRYHTREVAKFRVKEHNCLLLLSSATPDVETYYHAQQGTYSFNKLNLLSKTFLYFSTVCNA